MKKGYKSGFVTLIGRPNVGKSTLMNHLIGQKIAITSEKPQTTRNRIQTVYTDEHGQIIFLDTPGIHKAKNKLGEYMVNVADYEEEECVRLAFLLHKGTREENYSLEKLIAECGEREEKDRGEEDDDYLFIGVYVSIRSGIIYIFYL